MERLTNLLKEHQIGEWCKRAAWIIAVIGLIETIFGAYSLILQTQHTTSIGNNPIWWNTIVYVLQIPLPIIFYFFMLYAAGVFLNHFVPYMEEYYENEEGEPLSEEENEDTIPEQLIEITSK
jgi:hypothetical protein